MKFMMKNKYQQLFKELQKEKSSAPSSVNDHLMVFDGLNTFIRSFGATPAYNEDGDHIGGITGFLYSVGKPYEILNQLDASLFSMAAGVLHEENVFMVTTKQTEQIKQNCDVTIIMNLL